MLSNASFDLSSTSCLTSGPGAASSSPCKESQLLCPTAAPSSNSSGSSSSSSSLSSSSPPKPPTPVDYLRQHPKKLRITAYETGIGCTAAAAAWHPAVESYHHRHAPASHQHVAGHLFAHQAHPHFHQHHHQQQQPAAGQQQQSASAYAQPHHHQQHYLHHHQQPQPAPGDPPGVTIKTEAFPYLPFSPAAAYPSPTYSAHSPLAGPGVYSQAAAAAAMLGHAGQQQQQFGAGESNYVAMLSAPGEPAPAVGKSEPCLTPPGYYMTSPAAVELGPGPGAYGAHRRPEGLYAAPADAFGLGAVGESNGDFAPAGRMGGEATAAYDMSSVRSATPLAPRPARPPHCPERELSMYKNKMETKLCDVCEDTAAGFHCGAFVCEACKKFFIRSWKAENNQRYQCTKNEACRITKDTRTHCQRCRYKKCIALKMVPPNMRPTESPDISAIPCRVCGAQSSGFHFGAITCEGCKGFFRRTIHERTNHPYTCSKSGNCVINVQTRNNCKACRFVKCLNVGMSKTGSRIGRQPNAIKHLCGEEIRAQRLQQLQQQQAAARPVGAYRSGEGAAEQSLHAVPPDSLAGVPGPEGSALVLTSDSKASMGAHKASNDAPSVSPFPLSPPMPSVHQECAFRLGNYRSEPQMGLSSSDGAHQSQQLSSPPPLIASHSLKLDFPSQSADTIILPTAIPEVTSSDGCQAGQAHTVDAMSTDMLTSDQWSLRDFRDQVVVATSYLSGLNVQTNVQDEKSITENMTVRDVIESMMKRFHRHALQVIDYAKLTPEFFQISQSYRCLLVKEAMYSIMLIQLSSDYNLSTGEFNYFDFTRGERDIILSHFPSFKRICDHLRMSGQLIKPCNLDKVERALLCYIEFTRGDFSGNDEQIDQCSEKDPIITERLHRRALEALDDYIKTERTDSALQADTVAEIQAQLTQMNVEHRQIIKTLRDDARHENMSGILTGLYTEMFRLSESTVDSPIDPGRSQHDFLAKLGTFVDEAQREADSTTRDLASGRVGSLLNYDRPMFVAGAACEQQHLEVSTTRDAADDFFV